MTLQASTRSALWTGSGEAVASNAISRRRKGPAGQSDRQAGGSHESLDQLLRDWRLQAADAGRVVRLHDLVRTRSERRRMKVRLAKDRQARRAYRARHKAAAA